MKSPGSDFERGRKIVIILIGLAILLALYGGLFTVEGSPASVAAVVGVFLCFVAIFAAAARFCRCPHCGKRIISGVLVLKVCPKCGRNLMTGDKVRKAKKK